jgi:hypothetical protein
MRARRKIQFQEPHWADLRATFILFSMAFLKSTIRRFVQGRTSSMTTHLEIDTTLTLMEGQGGDCRAQITTMKTFTRLILWPAFTFSDHDILSGRRIKTDPLGKRPRGQSLGMYSPVRLLEHDFLARSLKTVHHIHGSELTIVSYPAHRRHPSTLGNFNGFAPVTGRARFGDLHTQVSVVNTHPPASGAPSPTICVYDSVLARASI